MRMGQDRSELRFFVFFWTVVAWTMLLRTCGMLLVRCVVYIAWTVRRDTFNMAQTSDSYDNRHCRRSHRVRTEVTLAMTGRLRVIDCFVQREKLITWVFP